MRAIPLPDGDLHYAPDFLTPVEADQFMQQLLDGIEWQQHHVVIFGHQHPAPRLSAWHGSPEAHYAYSGLALEPRPWTEPLLDLKTRVRNRCRLSLQQRPAQSVPRRPRQHGLAQRRRARVGH